MWIAYEAPVAGGHARTPVRLDPCSILYRSGRPTRSPLRCPHQSGIACQLRGLNASILYDVAPDYQSGPRKGTVVFTARMLSIRVRRLGSSRQLQCRRKSVPLMQAMPITVRTLQWLLDRRPFSTYVPRYVAKARCASLVPRARIRTQGNDSEEP